MTDTIDTDAPGPDVLAGEYVLGVLTAEEAAAVEEACLTDPAMRAAVSFWEDRLAGLGDMAEPEQPSPFLWQRIEHSLNKLAETGGTGPKRAVWGSVSFWRWSTALATAAALILVAVLSMTERQSYLTPRLTAVLQAPDTRPGWIVQVDAEGAVLLTPLQTVSVEPGRALQFWTKADADPGPTSLGLVGPSRSVRLPPGTLRNAGPGQLFEITLEPPGGSPIGRPTGPILFIGRGTQAI